MAHEHIGVADIVPQESPCLFLRRATLGNKIATDLDMRAVDDGAVWRNVFY